MIIKGFPGGSMVKSLPATQETWVWSLTWEDPLEKEMATQSSILARKVRWTEAWQATSLWGHRGGHSWVRTHTHMIIVDLNWQDRLNFVAGVQGKTDRAVTLTSQSSSVFRARVQKCHPMRLWIDRCHQEKLYQPFPPFWSRSAGQSMVLWLSHFQNNVIVKSCWPCNSTSWSDDGV